MKILDRLPISEDRTSLRFGANSASLLTRKTPVFIRVGIIDGPASPRLDPSAYEAGGTVCTTAIGHGDDLQIRWSTDFLGVFWRLLAHHHRVEGKGLH
jgi:hypothetical protein